MDYTGVIRRGWEITWNHKWLWALGFLAALASGTGSTSNFNFNAGDFNAAPGGISPEAMAALSGAALLLCCVFFVIGILIWLVSLAARGGLITGVVDLESGEKTGFGRAFRQGWRKLLPLIGMTLLLFAVLIVLILILVFAFAGSIAAAVAAGTSGDSQGIAAVFGSLGIVALCLLCLMIPLGIVLNLIYPFAYRGIMLRNMGVTESIRHGWRILRDNLGPILVLAIIFVVINLVIALVVGGVVAAIGIGGGLLSLVLTGGEITTGQMVAGGLGLLVVVIIFALISAVITAWRSATFTLAYEQWTGGMVAKEPAAPVPAE